MAESSRVRRYRVDGSSTVLPTEDQQDQNVVDKSCKVIEEPDSPQENTFSEEASSVDERNSPGRGQGLKDDSVVDSDDDNPWSLWTTRKEALRQKKAAKAAKAIAKESTPREHPQMVVAARVTTADKKVLIGEVAAQISAYHVSNASVLTQPEEQNQDKLEQDQPPDLEQLELQWTSDDLPFNPDIVDIEDKAWSFSQIAGLGSDSPYRWSEERIAFEKSRAEAAARSAQERAQYTSRWLEEQTQSKGANPPRRQESPWARPPSPKLLAGGVPEYYVPPYHGSVDGYVVVEPVAGPVRPFPQRPARPKAELNPDQPYLYQ